MVDVGRMLRGQGANCAQLPQPIRGRHIGLVGSQELIHASKSANSSFKVEMVACVIGWSLQRSSKGFEVFQIFEPTVS